VGHREPYTRRCFEIPACRRPLVSLRTEDVKSLFDEDADAVFFSSPEELLSKVRSLLADPKARKEIADAGYRRVYRDRHDIDSRASEMVEVATGAR